MRIIRDLAELAPPLQGGVVTIGNFDGVHLGHREIFRRVVSGARSIDGLAVVVTFAPHPLKVLTPERAPRLLNTYDEKVRLIEASCIDVLVEVPFDEAMADMDPEAFVQQVLVDKLGTCQLIVGYDYAFGRQRQGNVDFLKQAGLRHGFTVEMLDPIMSQGEVFSSTLVRRRLAAGDVAGVVELLGRNFTLEGRVIHGAKRGAGLGFPTANLLSKKEILPRPGVYAVKVKLDERCFDGVMNIGFNPTFGTERISLEVHLLDFDEDIYDCSLRVYFVKRLRDELVFESARQLVEQIRQDVEEARAVLADRPIIVYREYLDCGLPGEEIR